MDKEKVIKGLEYCAGNHLCSGCGYYDPDNARCQKKLMRNALELLEAQEAVKPMNGWLCGQCGCRIYQDANYCYDCGRKVKWDG